MKGEGKLVHIVNDVDSLKQANWRVSPSRFCLFPRPSHLARVSLFRMVCPRSRIRKEPLSVRATTNDEFRA